jgi:hypothetical protein
MTSFASAFGSSDHDETTSGINLNNSPNNHQQGSNNFSNIDLDQQSISPQQQHSSYVSLTDAATFRTDASTTNNNVSRVPTSSSQDLPTNNSPNTMLNTSSIPSDRGISMPDMSKISASSAAAVAAVGPTIDKLKQWGRSTYKCTKQTIYEKLGKTTRTVDVELDSQIEVILINYLIKLIDFFL